MKEAVLLALSVGLVIVVHFAGKWYRRRAQSGRATGDPGAQERDRNEALFQSMFPELQPHYHPERLVKFVNACNGRRGANGKRRQTAWADAPGFPGLAAAFTPTDKGERVVLTDAGGAVASEFLYQSTPTSGVLRVGKGKLTVDLARPNDPRVRYWHPAREFKWSRNGWIFNTTMADEPFATSNSDSGGVSFTSSSSGDSRVASAAALVGAGGAFDGGGASGGWDAGSSAPDSSASGAEAAGSSASGSETGDSTSY